MTAERKIFALFPPLRRGLERIVSRLLYSLDSKSCTADTVSTHALLMLQLLLSGAHATNTVLPRKHDGHLRYFVSTRPPLLCTRVPVQWVLRRYIAKLPETGVV